MARPWRKTEPKGEYGPGLRAAFAYLVSCYFTAVCLSFPLAAVGIKEDQPFFATILVGAFAWSLLVFFFVSILTFIPAAVFVALARHFRWVRGVADVIAGGLVGSAMGILISNSAIIEMNPVALFLIALYTFVGAISGLIYWFVAGRPSAPTRPVSGDETDL